MVQYLKNDEIDYELFIRGVKTKKNLSDKKTMLRKLLSKKAVIDLEENRLIFNDEKKQIDETAVDIRSLIGDFEGDVRDSVYRRAKAHLTHLSFRIARLPVEFEEEEEYKAEASADCLLLEGQLDDKVVPVGPSVSSNIIPSQPVVNIPAPVVQVSHPTNLADWNIKFSGDSKGVFPFLEKVRDLAESRNVGQEVLFRSAVELFTGSAAVWFRSVRSTVSSWNELIGLLKATFLPQDYDEDLWNQIKSRKQKKNESFALFQAQVMSLAKRLTVQPLEKTIVKHLRQNIIPEYIPLIALVDTNTVEELSAVIRKLENNVVVPSVKKETSVAYVNHEFPGPSRKANVPNGKANFKNNDDRSAPRNSEAKNPSKSTSNKSKMIVCFNCRRRGHNFNDCKQRFDRYFCFRCGADNVTVRTCPNCVKPSKNE